MINDNHSKKKIPINSISRKQASPKKIEKDILYALISIYYYEKTISLNNNKELIFNENKSYYFINPNWIINFKKVYNYQMLSQILKPLKLNNIPITYYNFERNISSIKDYLSQNNFTLKNDELEKSLMNNISAILRKSDNLVYCPYCYIVDMKIKNIFLNYVFQSNRLNICGQKVFAKNNFIYLNISNNIMSGNFNRNFIFISDHVLCFSSQELLLNEKRFLLKSSFSDYLKYKHIDKFSSDKMPLKDENNNTIGEIMLIPKNQTNNENKKSNPNSAQKNPMENNSNEQFKKINNKNGAHKNVNNSLEKSKIISAPKYNRIEMSKRNISESRFAPTNNTSSKKNFVNYSQPNGPKDNTSSINLGKNQNITGFSLYDNKLNLTNKDNNINDDEEKFNKGIKDYDKLRKDYLNQMNPQRNQIKKIDNQFNNNYSNEMKPKKENFDLKQKLEEKEIPNLREEKNGFQIKLKELENRYINKIKDLEKQIEIKNKI